MILFRFSVLRSALCFISGFQPKSPLGNSSGYVIGSRFGDTAWIASFRHPVPSHFILQLVHVRILCHWKETIFIFDIPACSAASKVIVVCWRSNSLLDDAECSSRYVKAEGVGPERRIYNLEKSGNTLFGSIEL